MPQVFIEPAIVPDVVVSGIAYTQEISPGMWRITLYDEQISAIDGSIERIIVAKYLISRPNGLACVKTVLKVWVPRLWYLGL